LIGSNFSFNTWRGLAIIFFILFLFEITFILVLFTVGYIQIQKETVCVNECTRLEGGGFYIFDSTFEICKCLSGDNKVVKSFKV